MENTDINISNKENIDIDKLLRDAIKERLEDSVSNIELQKFADEFHHGITVCHYPPCMSKWDKIEHRMFSHITINWRGKPLRSYETIIELIGNTTTKNGLKISADIDNSLYEKGKVVTDEELGKIYIVRDEFHGDWNYTIGSRTI